MGNRMKKIAIYASMTHRIHCALFTILSLLLTPITISYAEEKAAIGYETLDAIDEEIRWLQAETYVITPSRVPEKIKKTASSITVVTDKQIRQMGAKDIADVVRRAAPSFVTYRYVEAYNLISVRGGGTILLMINSLPVYDTTNQGLFYMVEDNLAIDNVKRIEFVRGPGSTLHGANAYDGVINIITKKAYDVDGVELSALHGSWDTQKYNILFGKTFSDLNVTFDLNYFKTHGYNALIKKDWQTTDDLLNRIPHDKSPISLAPGHTEEDEEKVDLSLNLEYKGFTFDGRYIGRETNEPLGFFNHRLTWKSTRSFKKHYLNLGYEKTIMGGLDFSAKVYSIFGNYIWDMQQGMPGYTVYDYYRSQVLFLFSHPPIGTEFPHGIYLLSDFKDNRTGIEIQTTFKMKDANTIVAGATYEKQKVYDDHRGANYLPTPQGVIQFPTVQRWPEEYLKDDLEMEFKALFLEDVWDITKNLRLTLGARYDDYSHFGGHFSPRAGLTWEYMNGYDLKLLYGHAFVVPGYVNILQRVAGSTIDPQTIDTYEVSFGADFTSNFEGRITLFRSDEKDLIYYDGTMMGYTNHGTSQSEGVEVEARYDFGRGTYIASNYVYTTIRNNDSLHYGKLMSNVRLSRYLNLYVDCTYKGDHARDSWDLSDHSLNRAVVNATLIARNFLKGHGGLEVRGSIYNLFDEDYDYKVDAGVPYGHPQPGINFLIEARYKF